MECDHERRVIWAGEAIGKTRLIYLHKVDHAKLFARAD